MSVNLSIKDVPAEIAEALRQRARQNHRSIQGELMAMLETHVGTRFRAHDLLREVRTLGVRTRADSADILREDRDRR